MFGLPLPALGLVGRSERLLMKRATEPLVIDVAAVQLAVGLLVLGEQVEHHPAERLVVFDAGVLWVGVLAGVLVGGILEQLRDDQLA